MGRSKVNQWLDQLLPRACVLCGLRAVQFNVCAGCRADLPWIRNGCARCGAPRSPGSIGPACGRCALVLDGIDRVFAALAYQYPVDRLVAAAKFGRRTDIACALGELLALAVQTAPSLPLPDRLVPVPLHRSRLALRGFNQSAEIARALRRSLRIPVDERAARRIRKTAEQSGLAAAARRANVRGAFRVRGDLRGLEIALVDDVVTTGWTVSALARALLHAGAERVQVWAVAAALKV